jgi:hypothetical protein
MSSSSTTSGKPRFGQWFDRTIAIANFVLLLVGALYLNSAQQRNLEEFRKQLSSTKLVYSYAPSSGDMVISNSGQAKTSGVQITILTKNRTSYQNIQSDIIVAPQVAGETDSGGSIFVFKIDEMFPSQEFAIRLNNQENPQLHPSRQDIDIKAFCSNCTGPAEEK